MNNMRGTMTRHKTPRIQKTSMKASSGLAQEFVVKESLCLMCSCPGDAVKRVKVAGIERGKVADEIGLVPLGEAGL